MKKNTEEKEKKFTALYDAPICEKTPVSSKYTYYVMTKYEPKLKDE